MEYMTAIFSLELLGSSRSVCDVVDNCHSSVHSNSRRSHLQCAFNNNSFKYKSE